MRRVGILAVAGAALAVAVGLTVAGAGDRAGALPNWQALVLGIVQGATELLPISSSGHLILVPWLFDWDYLQEHEEFNQTFDVALHVGTLVAVVAYFWRDVLRLAAAWIGSVRRRRVETADERIAWFVAIATVPAALIGALGEDLIAEHLGEPWQIAVFLALFAVALWVADRTPPRRRMSDLGPGTAIAVGLAQSLALMPGVSRSGITITAARFLGLDRDSAARISFLLLIPIVFGASLWKGVTDVLLGELPPGSTGPFLVGMIASAASGLLAIWGLLGYVRRHDYTLFVVYRLVLAALVLLLIATSVREPSF
ncbi:MAG TPA: undecaprenyl-diphosphatase UppP [Gaiellaceae bacterium]|nr:undecaprenyl-diphosphatase UppP [Gaiellaceae bacterium]